MKKIGCIIVVVMIILLVYENEIIVEIHNLSKTKDAIAIPIQNYSEVKHTPKSISEEQSYYISKRKNSYPKEVFLTFDDGPSINNTLSILNTLKSNNIKATFFVVGNKVNQYSGIVKQLNDSGMCVLPHSYSHDYKMYKNVSNYLEDLKACNLAIEKATGVKSQLYTRLPGGSDNSVSSKDQMKKIRNSLKENYIYYVDWNVSSADAAGKKINMEKIKENVINQCRSKKLAVVLMHDSYPKTTSAEALPYIIKYLKSQDFEFKTFNDINYNEERAMVKDGVINR